MNLRELKVNRKDVAELLRLNENYINELVREENAPKFDYDQYPLWEFIQWYIFIYLERKIENIKEGNSHSRLERGRAELIEMEIAIKHGTLINSNHLEDALNNEVSIFIKGLDVLKTKMANLLNLNAQQKEIIETEINSIRNQIGNLPADKSVSDIKFI